ncbi:tRNA 2-thiouridine(34) synthase MnmA [Sciscionella marina]|uniref:tRNA 2-thiouridine(34) synthase MnmA n=1 Tax=Sciscionella marina TaxID=508770 RepID=UPI00037D6A53|nr:tRNA 2-thiouridine(34) synthase MnmA [Sciscionella marina]
MKVLAAMSGGVDSAVAAARAVEAGHEVTGVHMALSAKPGTLRTGSRGCCTIEDAGDARRAADMLGIPFYVWDFSEEFTEEVVADFLAEYERGRTPNPCVRCNERIKFAALLERAIGLGFDAVCTGHYARLSTVDDSPELRRSVDEGKDQSYVLASLTAEQLRHSLFPLGGSRKSEVRAEAERRGLFVARKPDSHDICFIADGDTRGFVESRLGTRPGTIVDDETGEVLAEHAGVHGFTVGQRKGIGVEAPAVDGRPRYVLSLEPVTATVRVGSRDRLTVDEIECSEVIYPGGQQLAGPAEVTVQIRAHGGVAPAVVAPVEDGVTVHLRESISGVAPGQKLVAYTESADGDLALLAATIDRTA